LQSINQLKAKRPEDNLHHSIKQELFKEPQIQNKKIYTKTYCYIDIIDASETRQKILSVK